MANTIWTFADEGESESIKTPYEHLVEYALKLKSDTQGLIEGTVTEVVSDADTKIMYALYLVVPKLKNYNFRLIEVIQSNAFTPYPVNMKLFGKAEGTIIEEDNIQASDFEEKLKGFITSPLTKLILTHLKTHINIKNKYAFN